MDELNLSPSGQTYPNGEAHPGPRPRLKSGQRLKSDQNEIDQRDQGRSNARRDQGVVGAGVGFRVERWLAGFRGHFGALGRGGQNFCEAHHIQRIFFTTWSPGTG